MRRVVSATIAIFVCAGFAQAGIRADLSGDMVIDFQTAMDMPFMAIGSPRNVGDTEVMWLDGTTGHGSVSYGYFMGKFEVTAGQYCEFLNAVAATDTYGLYDEAMASWSNACGIEQTGVPGSYTYSVSASDTDLPVNVVTWGDAARFCNWLTNGRPSGQQDSTTTEDGSYVLNGALTYAELMAVTRRSGAAYVLPTEDEWYKAAYYDPDADIYYDYPTGRDTMPWYYVSDPDPGNNVNGRHPVSGNGPGYPMEVGECENTDSPFGTFDQAGNAMEMTEGVIDYGDLYRINRGGSWFLYMFSDMCHAGAQDWYDPSEWSTYLGFRVAYIPEPATLGLLGVGAIALLKRRRQLASITSAFSVNGVSSFTC